jgi:hypothetical protein
LAPAAAAARTWVSVIALQRQTYTRALLVFGRRMVTRTGCDPVPAARHKT